MIVNYLYHKVFVKTTNMFFQVVSRAEGRLHSLTLRDVMMTEAGEVKLTAKDFVTQAKLTVNGENTVLLHLCSVYTCFLVI